jgi:hypothetical protein
MGRRVGLGLGLAVALLGIARPTTAFADTPVVVDCGDGAPISATVDAATLAKLTASVQSILDNPTGMTCAVNADTSTIALAGGGSNPWVVGGGRYARGDLLGPGSVSQACGVNFSMSAHTDSTGYYGQQSYSINGADGCSPYQGNINANVTCLAVSGNTAEIRGIITHASGFFTGIQQSGLSVFVTDVTDNGPPSSPIRDAVYLYNDFDGTQNDCVAPGVYSYFERPVDNGNITVHD